jgi:hypothetical protein
MSSRKSSKSQKVLSRAENGAIVDHSKYIKTYRHHIMRVMRAIESGSVEEIDLEKMRNFLQMSLALMETAPMHQIQGAWRHAEILAFEHGGVADADSDIGEDHEVILGDTKLKEVERSEYKPLLAN